MALIVVSRDKLTQELAHARVFLTDPVISRILLEDELEGAANCSRYSFILELFSQLQHPLYPVRVLHELEDSFLVSQGLHDSPQRRLECLVDELWCVLPLTFVLQFAPNRLVHHDPSQLIDTL